MVSQLYSPRMGHDWALGCAHWISGIPAEPLITTDLDKASCRNGRTQRAHNGPGRMGVLDGDGVDFF